MTRLDRSIVPAIKKIERFNIIEAKKYTLGNGVPLFAIDNGDQDILKIDLIFPAGNWYQAVPLVAFAANNQMSEGSFSKSASEIANLMDFYGAYTNFSVDKDNATVGVLVLKKYLKQVLPLFYEILTEPAYKESELDIFRNKHKQIFEIEQSKVKNIARVKLSQMIFGQEHPYGYVIEKSDFDNLTSTRLKEFFNLNYNLAGAKIVLSGKINSDDIDVINQYFGRKINSPRVPLPKHYGVAPDDNRICFIEKADAVQSAIRIGKVFANKQDPDYTGLTILNVILGGYFGSRLMKNIREEKGFTYGINSLLISFIRSGYLAITTEVGSSVTNEAISEIYKELKILRTEVVPEEELERVKNYMLGETVRMFDGPFAQADSFISILEYDLGYEYYYNFIEQLNRITSDEILQLAQKHLKEEDFYQVVVGAPL
ncbi:MAG TPA: pitrilysin family protein [Bacteroidales bacterium]|nr:pitrilysin family protein [Bacteroidales bacterium]